MSGVFELDDSWGVLVASIVLVLVGVFGVGTTVAGMIVGRFEFIGVGLTADPRLLLAGFVLCTVLGIVGVAYDEGWLS